MRSSCPCCSPEINFGTGNPTGSSRLYSIKWSETLFELIMLPPGSSNRIKSLMAVSKKTPLKGVGGLYLAILSRPPTKDELLTIKDYIKPGYTSGRNGMVDLAWALINSPEFLYRH